MYSGNNHHEYKWKQPLHDYLIGSGRLGGLVGRARVPGVEGRIQPDLWLSMLSAVCYGKNRIQLYGPVHFFSFQYLNKKQCLLNCIYTSLYTHTSLVTIFLSYYAEGTLLDP